MQVHFIIAKWRRPLLKLKIALVGVAVLVGLPIGKAVVGYFEFLRAAEGGKSTVMDERPVRWKKKPHLAEPCSDVPGYSYLEDVAGNKFFVPESELENMDDLVAFVDWIHAKRKYDETEREAKDTPEEQEGTSGLAR